MPTSSFFKEFIIDSKKVAESLDYIISNPIKSREIDRSLTSKENEKHAEEKLKKILHTNKL